MKKLRNLIKGIWSNFLGICIGCWIVLQISTCALRDSFIDEYGVTIEGYITSERHVMVNTKVVDESSYNFGYEFVVNGVTYEGNSHQNKLTVGSPIQIEYCRFYPKFNRVKR